MAGASIKVDLDVSAAAAGLDRLDAALASPRPLMGQIGEAILLPSTKDRFSSQTGPDGQAWAPLSRRYAKRKKYNKDKVLTLRGYLRGQMRWQPDGDDAVRVGSNRVYARIHQLGGEIERKERSVQLYFRKNAKGVVGRLFVKKKAANLTKTATVGAHTVTVPARPFLGLSAADRQAIQQRAIDWLRSLRG
ncbi:MAG: phage virion morphogenesis protein [Comamonas sp.]